MAETNGYTKWLVGALFTILFTAFTTLTGHVIANDEKSRTRDDKIHEELRTMCEKQNICNQEILVSLAEIKQELRYIKRNGM